MKENQLRKSGRINDPVSGRSGGKPAVLDRRGEDIIRAVQFYRYMTAIDVANLLYSPSMSNSFARVQNRPVPKRQTVPVTIWVKPIEKEDLERVASAEKISLSQAGRTLMRKGMQTSVEMRYASFLELVIERVIARYLNNRDSRIISLLVRIAFDSGQTRSIVTNIVGLQPDITPDLLRDILSESDKRAKSNITRKTPQITELTEALEKWFFEADKKDREEPRG
jgi:hypothetical protein